MSCGEIIITIDILRLLNRIHLETHSFLKWLDAMQMCRDAKYCVSTVQQKTTFLKLDEVYEFYFP
jgi:hypothetical protein